MAQTQRTASNVFSCDSRLNGGSRSASTLSARAPPGGASSFSLGWGEHSSISSPPQALRAETSRKHRGSCGSGMAGLAGVGTHNAPPPDSLSPNNCMKFAPRPRTSPISSASEANPKLKNSFVEAPTLLGNDPQGRASFCKPTWDAPLVDRSRLQGMKAHLSGHSSTSNNPTSRRPDANFKTEQGVGGQKGCLRTSDGATARRVPQVMESQRSCHFEDQRRVGKQQMFPGRQPMADKKACDANRFHEPVGGKSVVAGSTASTCQDSSEALRNRPGRHCSVKFSSADESGVIWDGVSGMSRTWDETSACDDLPLGVEWCTFGRGSSLAGESWA